MALRAKKTITANGKSRQLKKSLCRQMLWKARKSMEGRCVQCGKKTYGLRNKWRLCRFHQSYMREYMREYARKRKTGKR